MTVIEHDVEQVSVTICADPECPHYRKRTMQVCFDRAHWETATFVPASQLQGAVHDRVRLTRRLDQLEASAKVAETALADVMRQIATARDSLGGQSGASPRTEAPR